MDPVPTAAPTAHNGLPASGAIVGANSAAARYYGWTQEQLQGMNIDRIDTLSAPELQAVIRKAQTSGLNSFEFQHRSAGGSVRDVEVFSGPMRIGDRKRLFSFVHDIGKRKRAEAELKASEARRADEHAAALETQRQGRLAALNLMEDAVAARSAAESTLAALRESEAPYRYEARMRHADGSWRWVAVLGKVVEREENGSAGRLRSVRIDITERKQSERKIRTQLDELLRWQQLTVGREERMLQLKAEVNELLARLGESARYSSQVER